MPTEPLEWDTVARRVAYSCPGFDVINEDVRLPDGTETDFDYLSESPSVGILPLTPDNKVVCIEEWRQAVGRCNYGIPAGGVEADDDCLEQAAERELAEETGYEANELEQLVTVEPANGFADAVLHLFVARGCRPTGDQQLDHNESIRVSPMAYSELLAAVGAGEVRDGRTVMAVSYYELFVAGGE